MKEYIERSEQESILKKRYYELAGMRPDFYAGYMTAFHIIEDDIPNAADVVEVRHGRWEERPVNVDTPTTDLFCSECNFASYHWRYNYCPICGAIMDKEE